MKNYYLLGILLFLCNIHYAQNSWTKTTPHPNDELAFVASRLPVSPNIWHIDIDEIKAILANAPIRFDSNTSAKNCTLKVPNKHGVLESYKIQEAPIMVAELAAQFPMIKTYVGQGIDDPSARLYMSIGTDGLHIMIRATDKAPLYVDPYSKNRDKYIIYATDELPALPKPNCLFENEEPLPYTTATPNTNRNITDGLMRTYNLAVATTIEYSAYHLNNQNVPAGASTAVKKAAVLSAITNTINRVRGLYETELAVSFVLNANQANIIFIDSDNFTNNDAGALIDESQTEIDNIIGNANYDVGHTFSTGGGGLASLGGICTVTIPGVASTRKAKAITGSGNPIGDAYDVDYVAHEMGHHFGANHSYNGAGVGSCNTSNASTAAEPGSGSTIMAYAGICGSLNVQSNSDAYFHIMSLQEINNRLTNAGGYTHPFYAQCSSNTATGNQEPIADAGNDYTIPKGTAFVLSGSANDPDGDAMTYCWDQIDLQQPNVYPLVSTTTTGPLYRSLSPSSSPKRYMPKFETVFGGALQTDWEVTPSVGRNLNFSLTVRDNRADGGQSTSDNNLISVSATAGPFAVTSQTTEEIWNTGESKTISWNVAGTTANGVNTANVQIALVDETDNVLSILAASTPNDGSHSISVPNVTNNNARVRVAAINNIFYAINSAVISLNTTPAYCSGLCNSFGSTQDSDGTTLVQFNTINNSSTGAASYSDYKNISTNLVRGQSYPLTVKVNTAGPYTETTKVWIDWNRDCVFNDTDEEYALGSASSVANGSTSNSPLSITVPANAKLGETRMRVTSFYSTGGANPNSCATGFFGEVEDYSLNIMATALPVELMSFSVKPTNEQSIEINWQTASEINNAGFELERSINGRDFENIAWIGGQANTTDQTDYQYVDRTITSNQIYFYRLKQIDIDGTHSFSHIQSAIVKHKDTQVAVYPNPATTRLHLSLSAIALEQNDLHFELFDAYGQKVLVQPIDQQTISISIESLPAGIYFYKIMHKTALLQSNKLVIQ